MNYTGESMEPVSLGSTIRKLRTEKKLTQEELANGICSTVSVSRIENDVQFPSKRILDKLLERLGAGTYELCNVFYETDKQRIFNHVLDKIAHLLSEQRIKEAKKAFQQIDTTMLSEPVNQQYYLLQEALIRYIENGASQEILDILDKALRLTKAKFDYKDFRNVLLTSQEANIIEAVSANKFCMGDVRDAISIDEELLFSLDNHKNKLRDYQVVKINILFNLSQYMEEESRGKEALSYCNIAEEESLNSYEHMLLPEIEFLKAKILHSCGEDETSLKILKTIKPYMELIRKDKFAAIVKDYALKEWNIEI